jgi:hypothetical protein
MLMVGAIAMPLVAGLVYCSWPRANVLPRPSSTTAAVAEIEIVFAPTCEPAPAVHGEAKSRGRYFPPSGVKARSLPLVIATKSDGSTPETTAAHYARVKVGWVPDSVAKVAPATAAMLASLGAATEPWVRLSPTSSDLSALNKATEVAFGSVKDKDALRDLHATVLEFHRKGNDAFVDSVTSKHADLAGLPFTKGSTCRLTATNAISMARASFGVRQELDDLLADPYFGAINPTKQSRYPRLVDTDIFWRQAGAFLTNSRISRQGSVHALTPDEFDHKIRLALLPAMMQIVPSEATSYRASIAQQLAVVPEGTEPAVEALVRLALFEPFEDVRRTAISSLRKHPPAASEASILAGFRHPWPVVAHRAADVIIANRRIDVVRKLADFLDEPDPAAPFRQESAGPKTFMVRELVRINHHRNCLMCHPPADDKDVRTSIGLVARVPSCDEALPPSVSNLYYSSRPGDILVRANETYLRPDFSLFQEVVNSGRWPHRQRFDFIVRVRPATPEEVERSRAPRAAGNEVPISAQHQAALSALRELTGWDLGTQASAWRTEIARVYGNSLNHKR